MLIRIRLSLAQASAFECRDWDDDPTVRDAWDGDRTLLFDHDAVALIISEITDASNAEDAHAQQSDGDCRTFANRAARSLAIVTDRILKKLRTI